ncbi:serine--tRNA ligase [Actinomadura sp. 7K507]|nr:serine--tRNA ligase [Actinomadura sp. 7K507]
MPVAVRRLARRGFELDLDWLQDLVSRRSKAIEHTNELRAEANQAAKNIQKIAREGGDVEAAREQARRLKDEIQVSDEAAATLDEELRAFLLTVPNLPADRAPDGDSEEFAEEVRRWGEPRTFEFEPKDHVDLGEALGILDFKRATKLSGPRFAVMRAAGARLERALAQFFLDLHTGQHGYDEHYVPYLVTPETMTGTGQLPKFEEDLFRTDVGDRTLYLVPTAEVPLTNLYAGEMLNERDLPIALTSYTPCFRSEAGSYGKDTRGMLRQHQFSKVELVRICRAEDSAAELEKLTGHAERCLRELGLAYRVVALATGDIGFSAHFTYDLEVWVPSQGRYREVSSCSDCTTFQARRARIRVKGADGKKTFAATLNGSGLAVGRTMIAILEQSQQADGSVVMPDALVPYLGFGKILPGGKVE